MTHDRELEHLRRGAAVSGVEVDEFVEPASCQMLAGSTRLHYLDWGGAGEPTILFLHGGGLTAHTWDLVCLALHSRSRCLAPDLRGHGDSEWSPTLEYSLDDHVLDVEHLVQTLGLDQFVLIGGSLGGLVAIKYATRHSDELKGLVIVDVGLRIPSGAQHIRDFMAMEPELPTVDDFVRRALKFNPSKSPELLRASLLHNLRRLRTGGYSWKYDHRYWGHLDVDRVRVQYEALMPEVSRITCATLLLRGERSEVLLQQDAMGFVESLPNARLETIPAAGHNVQGDNPRDVTGAIRRFVAECSLEAEVLGQSAEPA
jgi:pimeloyl-ACP methyl ester carboxylesterase